MTDLVVDNISVKIGDAVLVKKASFNLRAGELVAILGPNGAGKTSVLRAALGLQKISSGMAKLGGENTHLMSPMSRAKRVAYLPQMRPLAWPNEVQDIVALGRFSHGANISRLKGMDREAVNAAIKACDIETLRTRKADTLSGGEIARVHCARAFAAKAPLMIADEPVAALDPRHQHCVMDLIKDYVNAGGGALVVLHDIALAAQYADRLIWMKDGVIVADGKPKETLSEKRLADIYGVKAEVSGDLVRITGVI